MNSCTNHKVKVPLDCDSLLDAAFSSNLSPCEFKVYFQLVRLVDKTVEIAESIDRIAKLCNLNRKTVMRVLDSLISMGMLRRLQHGRSYLHQLTMSLDWVERPKKAIVPKTDYATPVPKTDYAVQKTDLRVVDSSKPPLGGVCYESNQLPVQQADYSPPVQQANYSPPVQPQDEPTDLDSKLAAARARGWITGIYWNDQREQMVTVNRFTIPVAEFMERSLDAFDCASQWCAAGAARIWEVLNKIKRRSHVCLQ